MKIEPCAMCGWGIKEGYFSIFVGKKAVYCEACGQTGRHDLIDSVSVSMWNGQQRLIQAGKDAEKVWPCVPVEKASDCTAKIKDAIWQSEK